MDAKTRVQLSVMMFVQFFIWGAWYVTAPNYLTTIGFTDADISWTYAIGPIACIISPFFVGMIADRFFAAQKVVGVLHIVGGLLVLLATQLMKSSPASADAINWAMFAHTLAYFPTIALTNTIAMRTMTNSEKEFPLIRVFGTIGWIAAGLALTFMKWETTISMFYLTAAASIAMGLFSFMLPDTPPTATGKITASQILGLEAFALFKNRSYLIFMAASLLICIPLSFYYQLTSTIVEMSSLPIGATMSYGQMSEIFFMLVMPLCFARLGVKWMLAVGMLAWVVRYALFAFGAPAQIGWMVIGGILLHGICYDFFFVTGQIYTDQAAPKQIRAQAQGLLVLFTLGIGMALGAKVAGYVKEQHTPPASLAASAQVVSKTAEIETLKLQPPAAVPDGDQRIAQLESEKTAARLSALRAIEWKPLWGKPAIFAAAILLLFVLLFQHQRRPASEV